MSVASAEGIPLPQAPALSGADRVPPVRRVSPWQALALSLVFTLALFGIAFVDSVRQSPRVWWSLVGSGLALLVWEAVLFGWAHRTGRTLTLGIALKKQHYVQACAQGSVLLYWGWHWPQVYESAHLIAAQLVFAYAFDMLLIWSRRDGYTLGFGPFPVVFSINLFLWFRPDWFYLQQGVPAARSNNQA